MAELTLTDYQAQLATMTCLYILQRLRTLTQQQSCVQCPASPCCSLILEHEWGDVPGELVRYARHHEPGAATDRELPRLVKALESNLPWVPTHQQGASPRGVGLNAHMMRVANQRPPADVPVVLPCYAGNDVNTGLPGSL